MNFLKKVVFTSTALLLSSSSVYAEAIINPNIKIIAKAIVMNLTQIPAQSVQLLEWIPINDPQDQERYNIYVEVLIKSGFDFSDDVHKGQIIAFHRELRLVIDCIKDIVIKSVKYEYNGKLDNIVNKNMNLKLLKSNGLSLFEKFILFHNDVASFGFDIACFKSLMEHNHNLWLLPIYNEYKNEDEHANDDNSTYNKIISILKYHYYLLGNPNYSAQI